MPEETRPSTKKQTELKDFLIPFLVPTLLGKALILYFGLNYSADPDGGYGTGLILSILFTLGMIARFLWVTRNYED